MSVQGLLRHVGCVGITRRWAAWAAAPVLLLAASGPACAAGGLRAQYFATKGGPLSVAVGPDGALWTRDEGSFIERIGLSGHDRAFRVRGLNAGSTGAIAAGPDGALWFDEDTAGCYGGPERFGRITPAGRISHIVIPRYRRLKGVNFSGPVQGYDGNMWFASGVCSGGPTGGLIGRITPAGRVTQWPVGFFPQIVVRGPDEQMWFASEFANQVVVSVSVSGRLERRHVAISPQVTRGPDHAFWEALRNGVLRERLNGTRRVFPYPPGDQAITGEAIAPGPHNDIWFAADYGDPLSSGAQAGYVERDGRIQTVALGNGRGSPSAITPAPDGSVWVAQFYGPLVRLTPPGGPAPGRARAIVLHLAATANRGTATIRCRGVLGTFCSETLGFKSNGKELARPVRFTVAADDRLTITRSFSRSALPGAIQASIVPAPPRG